MKVLLTGFNPFGNWVSNPSQLVVESLGQRAKSAGSVDLVTEVLPTEYAAAGTKIARLIGENRPDSIICLGVAAHAERIHLERVALNLDDSETPDNAAQSARGSLIVPDAPLAYWSTLPIEAMRTALQKREIPATISNHAGTYVCNHVFYMARYEIETLGLSSACGFIHLPRLLESNEPVGQHGRGLHLETMVEAIELCISLVAKR